MSYKSIGKQLQLARELAGWSQEQLAARIGCSQSTLSNYEKGKRRIYLAQLEKIAEIINRPVEFFLRPADYVLAPQEEWKDAGELCNPPQPAGCGQRTEPLRETFRENDGELALLETFRSLSVEGKKLAQDFIDWVKKREVAGNG